MSWRISCVRIDWPAFLRGPRTNSHSSSWMMIFPVWEIFLVGEEADKRIAYLFGCTKSSWRDSSVLHSQAAEEEAF